MSHLWPKDWYDLSDEDKETLRNMGYAWAEKGYENLEENDYARLEPFLEPFDAVYTDTEIAILSRTGNNGIQKEFCSMFIQEEGPETGNNNNNNNVEEVWVLEWYLDQDDVRRRSLRKIAKLLYGDNLNNDETQCLIMLTHALSSLRQLVITIHGDTITGEIEDLPEALIENEMEEAEIMIVEEEDLE